jgi:5'-deoxynucleotidase YfbR-like HD superfamily hydrolase
MSLSATTPEIEATLPPTAIKTFNGHVFDVFDPQTWVFDLDDIAHATAHTCRFGGHTHFYSVAEHSMRVADQLKSEGCSPRMQMIGLLHDAIEAYIGDIPRPIKQSFYTLVGEDTSELRSIHEVEKDMEYALFNAYGLYSFPDDDYLDTATVFELRWRCVKLADMNVYWQEAKERPNVGKGLSPLACKREFLNHYHYLEDQFQ